MSSAPRIQLADGQTLESVQATGKLVLQRVPEDETALAKEALETTSEERVDEIFRTLMPAKTGRREILRLALEHPTMMQRVQERMRDMDGNSVPCEQVKIEYEALYADAIRE